MMGTAGPPQGARPRSGEAQSASRGERTHSFVDDLFTLRGRVAAVTGASSGIGLLIAETFARAGAAVVLVARRADELERNVAAIGAFEGGGGAASVACDLADRSQIPDCAVRIAKPFGDPDIVVNAAGINRRGAMDALTEADWDDVLAINLAAPFFLTRLLAPAMIARGWGRVINIASLQSVLAMPNCAPYGASKGGIDQLTRAQAEAWSRHGVNCNAIAPGFFPTPLTAAVYADAKRVQAMAARTMAGRNGELDDLRGVAVFLASRASAYVTGQTIFVDGGFTSG